MAFDPVITGIVGALAGTALSNALSYWAGAAQFRREKHWEHRQFVREKLEELHQNIEEFKREHVLSMGVLRALILGNPDARVGAPKTGDLNVGGKLSKVRLLTNFYAPEIKDSVGAISDTLQEFTNFVEETIRLKGPAKSDPAPNEPATLIEHEIRVISKSIEVQCEALQTQLAMVAIRYSIRL